MDLGDVGFHHSIEGGILGALRGYYEHIPKTVPVQTFLGSNIQCIRRMPSNAEEVKKYVIAEGIRYFIHGPYTINLATRMNPDEKFFQCVTSELRIADALGAKGVVYHVGKSLKQSPEEGVRIMAENVAAVMAATEGRTAAKFLLETPAGKGTELLCEVEDFAKFCIEARKAHGERFGIVVDTCHVFDSGYEDPAGYLLYLLDMGLEVDLVHLNDSKGEAGCCMDRHERIGKGGIGAEKMGVVMEICRGKGIPMIHE